MRRSITALVVGGLALLASLLAFAPVHAQQPPARPALPFPPDWAQLEGFKVFADKGCGGCHAVRGFGPTVGPDLGRSQGLRSFFGVAAAMWNHLPRMGAQMREARVERARLTPGEASNLVAFLFTAQYQDELGDPKSGETLFTSKGCAKCHALAGRGGLVGPALDRLKNVNSPVIVAAAMWNHGPQMAEAMAAVAAPRPTFEAQELLDLIAHVTEAARDPGAPTQQIVPGTPERGRRLFADKKCAACHAVGGQGPRVGPDLGRPGHHVSLTAFAARMWNHAPAMAEKMRERKIEVPKLSGQEMADVLAYLYVSRYFEPAPSAARGRQLVQDKGCTTCHSVAGKGGKAGADFATSSVVRTPAGLVAGMWNHSRLMEAAAQKREVAWPMLTGPELGDIAAYLTSLPRPGAGIPAPPKPGAK